MEQNSSALSVLATRYAYVDIQEHRSGGQTAAHLCFPPPWAFQTSQLDTLGTFIAIYKSLIVRTNIECILSIQYAFL